MQIDYYYLCECGRTPIRAESSPTYEDGCGVGLRNIVFRALYSIFPSQCVMHTTAVPPLPMKRIGNLAPPDETFTRWTSVLYKLAAPVFVTPRAVSAGMMAETMTGGSATSGCGSVD